MNERARRETMMGRYERGVGMAGKDQEAAVEDGLGDFTMDELREFLEADLVEVRADPEFKERVRRRLWEMVQARSGAARRRGVR